MKTWLILIPTAIVDTSTVTVVQREEVAMYTLSFNTDSYYNRRNCSMKTCLILIPTATVETSTVTPVQRE